MKFTQSITAAILAATSVTAAPAAAAAKSNLQARGDPAPVPNWIIEKLTRTCAEDDSSCTWHFFLNAQIRDTIECTYVVESPGASKGAGTGTCGDYSITSNYHADGAGWTALNFVYGPDNYIAYTGWEDPLVQDGSEQADKNAVVEYPWHP